MRVRDRSAIDWGKFVRHGILTTGQCHHSRVTVHNISGLMHFLKQNPTIKYLFIIQLYVNFEMISLLADNKTLTCLDLRDVRIDDAGVTVLACNITLDTLRLGHCNIGLEEAKALAKILPSKLWSYTVVGLILQLLAS